MSVLDDLAARLVTQGVGVLGTSIFISSAAVIPTDMGPYLSLSETGGVAPTRVQNVSAPNTQRPSIQVLCRAGFIAGVQDAYPAARTMAKAAYDALDGIFNTMLSGTFYLHVTAKQEPTDMGFDATGSRLQVVFNLDVEKSLS